MKLKKIFIVIMVLSLCCLFLVACGSDYDVAEVTRMPSKRTPKRKPAQTFQAENTVVPAETSTPYCFPMPTERPTAVITERPVIIQTPVPTIVPTKEPIVKDPEVDAILYRFHHADKYMWEVEDFMTSDDIGIGQTAIGIACNYYHVEGEGLAVEIFEEDPYFTMPNTGEKGEEFNLADYPIFKIRLKNETAATKFEMFLAKAGISAGDEFRIEISTEDTEYKDYVVNLAEIKDRAYVDDRSPVKAMRMDTLHFEVGEFDASDSTTIYIDYFGFFKTVEDAQNWNPSHVSPVEAPATDIADSTPIPTKNPYASYFDVEGIVTRFDELDESYIVMNACEPSVDGNDPFLTVVSLVGDKSIIVPFGEYEEFDPAEYPYIAFRYRVGYGNSIGAGNHFYIVTSSGGPTADTGWWYHPEMTADADWHLLVINIAEAFPATTDGSTVKSLRVPIAAEDGGSFAIAYMGAFKTQYDITSFDTGYTLTYADKLVKDEAITDK